MDDSGGGKDNGLNLFRIDVFDTTSNKCLYVRLFPQDSLGAPSSGIGSFVSVLYQFAREVDYGTISRVVYEPNWTARPSTGGLKWGADSRDGPLPCEMVTLSREGVVISIFHNCAKHSRVQRLAQEALDDFLKVYTTAERWEEHTGHPHVDHTGDAWPNTGIRPAAETELSEQRKRVDQIFDLVCKKHAVMKEPTATCT